MESKCLLNSKAHKDDDEGGVVDNDHLLDSQEVAELPLTKEIVENIVNMIVSIEILEVLESSSYTDGEIFQNISDGIWTVSALQMAACCHLESQSMPNFKVLSVMLGGIASHCLRDDDNESLVRFALLLRGMIISAIICNQDGLCDEVFNLFQQASEMIHLAGGKYPEDEVIWLVTKSYNISKTDGCQTKSQRLCKESLSMCRWINQVGLRQKYELVIRAEYGKLLLGSLA